MRRGGLALWVGVLGWSLPVFAGVPSNVPVVDDVALQKFLKSLAEHLNTLECLSANPDGSVLGTHGELKCANYGGAHYICMNTGTGPAKTKTWTCLNVAGTSAAITVEDDDVVIDANVTDLDLRNNLTVTSSPAGEANINAVPSGLNTQVQFNDSNIFGADTGFTFEKNSDNISLRGGSVGGTGAGVLALGVGSLPTSTSTTTQIFSGNRNSVTNRNGLIIVPEVGGPYYFGDILTINQLVPPVLATIYVEGNSTTSGAAILELIGTSGHLTPGQIILGDDAGGTTVRARLLASNTNRLTIDTNGGGGLIIDSAGRVGFGMIPAVGNQVDINGNLNSSSLSVGTSTFTGNQTIQKSNPTFIYDVVTATDTDFWTGVQDDAGSDDDDKYQIGDGITPGSNVHLTILTDGSVGLGNASPASRLVVEMPSTQTIAAGNTITADGCGTIKRITASGAVTTDTTNTFTAPSAGTSGCIMHVCNIGSNNITLDNNANFKSAGAADVVMTQDDCVVVGSTGSGGVWYQLTTLEAN